MSNIYESAWWSVELPSGWLGSDDDGCVTFVVNDDGVGALQISAYGSGDKEVTDEDLEDFIRDDGKEISSSHRVSYGQFVGRGICAPTATGYWRKYWLRAGSVGLFVTYNCKVESEGVEDHDVDQILRSLALNECVSQREGLVN